MTTENFRGAQSKYSTVGNTNVEEGCEHVHAREVHGDVYKDISGIAGVSGVSGTVSAGQDKEMIALLKEQLAESKLRYEKLEKEKNDEKNKYKEKIKKLKEELGKK